MVIYKMMNNNLKYARENLEMTQEELGYVFGVKKATVSNWENGYDIIPLNKLIRLCNLYDYSLDFIVGFTRENKVYPKMEKMTKATVGKKLKDLRIKLGLTQQQIADECSISRATYCHYEIGMNLVSTITIYSICKNHNLSMDAFFRN